VGEPRVSAPRGSHRWRARVAAGRASSSADGHAPPLRVRDARRAASSASASVRGRGSGAARRQPGSDAVRRMAGVARDAGLPRGRGPPRPADRPAAAGLPGGACSTSTQGSPTGSAPARGCGRCPIAADGPAVRGDRRRGPTACGRSRARAAARLSPPTPSDRVDAFAIWRRVPAGRECGLPPVQPRHPGTVGSGARRRRRMARVAQPSAPGRNHLVRRPGRSRLDRRRAPRHGHRSRPQLADEEQ
jgi:hypothetical protein